MINEVYSVHGMSFSNPTKEDLALSGYTTRVRLPGAVYYPDGSVEFTLFAPEAEHVEVSGMPGSSMGEEKIPLKKNGGWLLDRCGKGTAETVSLCYILE